MIKTVYDAHGHSYRLGRRRPPSWLIAKTPRFAQFQTVTPLPAPPVEAHFATKAMPALRDIYGNDVLGDCVIAMLAHVIGVLTGNVNKLTHYSLARVIAEYSGACGYVPGQPRTDQGCDELSVFNYATRVGFTDDSGNNHKIAGYVALDATNVVQMKQALWLFENLCFGLELPDAWINPFPGADNFTWDVAGAPDPNNGHAFMSPGYYPNAPRIDTWALLGNFPWASIAKYCVSSAGGGVYAVFSQDSLNRATYKSPLGYDWLQLQAYFASL